MVLGLFDGAGISFDGDEMGGDGVCDVEAAYSVAGFGCLAQSECRSISRRNMGQNNAAVSAVLFVPRWEEPKHPCSG